MNGEEQLPPGNPEKPVTPLGYVVGGAAAEIADAMGGDSKQGASGMTWRLVSGVIEALIDDSGKPKISKDEALDQVRNGLDKAPWT